MAAKDKPRLAMTGSKDKAMTYCCSLCGQLFILPDDRSPKDAAAEVLAAFQEHVAEEHAGEAKD